MLRWLLRIILRLESLVKTAVDKMIKPEVQNTAEWVMKTLRKSTEGVEWKQVTSEEALQLLAQATASDKLGGDGASQTVVTYVASLVANLASNEVFTIRLEKQCGGLTHPHVLCTTDLLLSTAKGKTDER